ncbi:hypothetical protein HXX76_007594 [Chlamydomonas incerta]|uniref:UBC core domain-containing protein n=1 Tax=Chlamydomonas incerta TaxID=51695 RepID=A0A835T6F5_CHLIN|nr:hypothetical protein HXX76_007594 [Chlamydomonas incerta]|eukprot:KAG2434704.1 hypothetical protein HXX76_007594 [Chlamydomonas incerta]
MGDAPAAPASAVRRLQRDLRQWERDKEELGLPVLLRQLPAQKWLARLAINMAPKEGPFAGQAFHLHATFPPEYPHAPPDVRLLQAPPGFAHPNLFAGWSSPLTGEREGSYICLDMIKPNVVGPYKGWSAAYDISGLVLQLYGFLLADDSIEQEGGGAVARQRQPPPAPSPPELQEQQEGEGQQGRGHGHRWGLPAGGGAATPAAAAAAAEPRQAVYGLTCACGFHELPRLQPASSSSSPPPASSAAAATVAAVAAAGAADAAGAGDDDAAMSDAADAAAGPDAAGHRPRSSGSNSSNGQQALVGRADEAAGGDAEAVAGGGAAAAEPSPPDLPMEIIHKIFTHADAGTVSKATAAATAAATTSSDDGAAAQPPPAKRAHIAWAPPPAASPSPPAAAAAAPAPAGAAPGGPALGAAFAHLLLLSDAALRAKQEAELVCFFTKAPPAAATWVTRSEPAAAGAAGAAGSGGAGAASGTAATTSRQADSTRASGESGGGGGGGDALLDDLFQGGGHRRGAVPPELDVLGVGVSVDWHERGGSLRQLSMTHDTLSLAAFAADGVRRSAWNQPFDAFLPLAVNAAHGRAALRVLRHSVAAMLRLPHAQHVRAEHLLDVVARLMNTLVVGVCTPPPQKQDGGAVRHAHVREPEYDQDRRGGGRPPVPRHMSDAALQSFCHLHHLLLTLVVEGEGGGGGGLGRAVLEAAARDVCAFIARPEARRKSACPDLGLLLVKFLLVPRDTAPWAAFAPPFVRELLARQVRWVVKGLADERPPPPQQQQQQQQPQGAAVWSSRGATAGAAAAAAAAAFERPREGGGDRRCAQRLLTTGGGEGAAAAAVSAAADATRLRQHFTHARTSLALVALQAFFANRLARPSSSATALQQLAAIKASYDARNGQPPAPVFEAFNAHARSVIAQRGWSDFLTAVHMGVSEAAVAAVGAAGTAAAGGGAGGGGRAAAAAAVAPAATPTTTTVMVGDVARVMADTLRQAVVEAHRAGYQDGTSGRGGRGGGGGGGGGGSGGRSRWDREPGGAGHGPPPRHVEFVDWDGPTPPLLVVGAEW